MDVTLKYREYKEDRHEYSLPEPFSSSCSMSDRMMQYAHIFSCLHARYSSFDARARAQINFLGFGLWCGVEECGARSSTFHWPQQKIWVAFFHSNMAHRSSLKCIRIADEISGLCEDRRILTFQGHAYHVFCVIHVRTETL